MNKLNLSDFCVTMKLISAAAVHRWNNFWSSRSSSYKIWQLLQKGGGKSSQSVCAVVDELSIWQKMTSFDICQVLLSYIQSDVTAVSTWLRGRGGGKLEPHHNTIVFQTCIKHHY